ncbi:MAG: SGNH/GDSL hydrolase family protein [Phycisphaeraceae bacterium]|nr:SGNH/GDSL hydrolase family protein [Phycisphaeraceae bacterium]
MPLNLQLPASLNTYFRPRYGLGKVGHKLAQGQDVTTVFFGGSITQGASASDSNKNSYRARTTQWLKEQYPQSNITSINAGIGGTGSDLGVFRCKTDVMNHQPDLVFIEFAVNDGGLEDKQSIETFEGILRQLLQGPDTPDVCIIYTLRESDVDTWHAGKLSPRAQTQEQLASHYNLPSVSLAKGIADAIHTKQATFQLLMNDHVHPLDAGHELYAKVLTGALESMFTQTQPTLTDLPTPLSSDHYALATMQQLPHTAQGWTWIDLENKGGWECFDGLLTSNTPRIPGTPAATLALPFHGKLVGLHYQLGPETGNLHYQIDDGPQQLLEPFDSHAVKCIRPQYRILDDQLEHGEHTLHLRIAESKDERSKGTWTRLAHLLIG